MSLNEKTEEKKKTPRVRVKKQPPQSPSPPPQERIALEIDEDDEPEPEPETVVKRPKRPRSDAQKAVFERAQAKRLANAEQRRKEKEEKDREFMQEVEQKVVKKAIAVKKRQIKQAMIIDKIPDADDVNDDEIRRVVAQSKKKILFV